MTSPNRPAKRDVIGTAVLGIVDGAKRFRHFDSLAGDGVSAETIGLGRVIHCDSGFKEATQSQPKQVRSQKVPRPLNRPVHGFLRFSALQTSSNPPR